jgi:uncharacterized protein YbjT (DUF2867 family)
MPAHTTLVLGGTGKSGRRIVERLRSSNRPVRVGSRAAVPAFDWNDPDSWDASLQGIKTMYLSFYPDLAAPGAEPTIRALLERAVTHGVQRLVLLSGRGEPEAQRCEYIVKSAPLEWTIIRSSWFAQNFSESFLLEPVLAGHVALPVGDVGEPFVDADDVADIAVLTLQGGHGGNTYEATGPRLWTFADAFAAIGRATQQHIGFERISARTYATQLRTAGLPDEFVGLLLYLFSEVLDGRNATTSGDIQRLLGRPAREFADYVRETAATGVWNAGLPAMSSSV